MDKVYLVWHYSAEDDIRSLDKIYAGKDAKVRAQKYADEQTIAWAEDCPDDYYEVEGKETY